jgi:hypothetical protein
MGDTAFNNPRNIPIIGQFMPDKNTGKAEAALNTANAQYDEYRPMQAQSRMEALQAQSRALEPVQNQLTAMYGPSAHLTMPDGKLPPSMQGYMDKQAAARARPPNLPTTGAPLPPASEGAYQGIGTAPPGGGGGGAVPPGQPDPQTNGWGG